MLPNIMQEKPFRKEGCISFEGPDAWGMVPAVSHVCNIIFNIYAWMSLETTVHAKIWKGALDKLVFY